MAMPEKNNNSKRKPQPGWGRLPKKPMDNNADMAEAYANESAFSRMAYLELYPNGKYPEYIREKIYEMVGDEMQRVTDEGTKASALKIQEIEKVLTPEDLIIIRDESGPGYTYELRRPFWMEVNGGEKYKLMGPDADKPGKFVKGYTMYFPKEAVESETQKDEEVSIVD